MGQVSGHTLCSTALHIPHSSEDTPQTTSNFCVCLTQLPRVPFPTKGTQNTLCFHSGEPNRCKMREKCSADQQEVTKGRRRCKALGSQVTTELIPSHRTSESLWLRTYGSASKHARRGLVPRTPSRFCTMRGGLPAEDSPGHPLAAEIKLRLGKIKKYRNQYVALPA